MKTHLPLIICFIIICYYKEVHSQNTIIEYAQPFKDSLDLRPYTRVFVDSTKQLNLQQVQKSIFYAIR